MKEKQGKNGEKPTKNGEIFYQFEKNINLRAITAPKKGLEQVLHGIVFYSHDTSDSCGVLIAFFGKQNFC